MAKQAEKSLSTAGEVLKARKSRQEKKKQKNRELNEQRAAENRRKIIELGLVGRDEKPSRTLRRHRRIGKAQNSGVNSKKILAEQKAKEQEALREKAAKKALREEADNG